MSFKRGEALLYKYFWSWKRVWILRKRDGDAAWIFLVSRRWWILRQRSNGWCMNTFGLWDEWTLKVKEGTAIFSFLLVLQICKNRSWTEKYLYHNQIDFWVLMCHLFRTVSSFSCVRLNSLGRPPIAGTEESRTISWERERKIHYLSRRFITERDMKLTQTCNFLYLELSKKPLRR